MADKKTPCLIPERVIPGNLSKDNQFAIDWGYQGLIAYGCYNNVIILEHDTLQIIQTLILHKSSILLVKWARENYRHDIAKPYSPRLASVDDNGKIVVWDVAQGIQQAVFLEPNKPVEDLAWLKNQDASVDLLVAIHSPNLVVLWNADTGTKLWKKCYDLISHLRSLTFDCFDMKNMAFLGSDCVLFVNDFAVNCEPPSNGKKFYMTLDKNKTNSNKNTLASSLEAVGKVALSGIKLLMGDERPKHNEVALLECLQLLYLPASRHHLAAVFPREILILDVSTFQAVASIPIERSTSSFLRVLPTQQRNAFYCVHENGSVSFRVQKCMTVSQTQLAFGKVNENLYDLSFELVCHSESFRVTNKVKPFCASVCPISETHVAVMISDGRIFIWNLRSSNYKANDSNHRSNLFAVYAAKQNKKAFLGTLRSVISPLLDNEENRKLQKKIHLQFALTGCSCEIVSQQITCIKMCPPLTHKNWPHYHPLIAVGLYNGNIQVFNIRDGHLLRELSVHTCQVRGIEWSSLRSFVSFGYAEPSSNHQNSVFNELKITDLDTGKTVALREGKTSEPIVEFIRISYQRQYLIVVFHSKPFELWDIRSRQLLRELTSTFTNISALEWAPGHTTKKSKSDFIGEDCANVLTREHLVLTDSSSKCYHCIAESSSFKLGSCIPNKSNRDAIVSGITWKGDHLFMGNSEGTMTAWDLQEKIARSVSTYQGHISKVKFGPGKGNFKVLVLYEEGVDIWDAQTLQCISTLHMPKSRNRIVDIDWCASENPVIAFKNSMIVVTGLDLKIPMKSNSLSKFHSRLPITCPYFLPPKLALIFKAILLQGNVKILKETTDLPGSIVDILNAKISSLTSVEKDCLMDSCMLVRSSSVARIFGDESEINFFSVLSNCLETNCKPLGVEVDSLSQNSLFKLSEVIRNKRQILLRQTEHHTGNCVRNLILLGQIDHAIQLSLETESHTDKYYTDGLKVCLLTSLNKNPEASQSTVKLVSTNLIASGKLLEGVELLCMIDKPYDACRYLSSSGLWDLAVWLAKVRLSNDQYENIVMNWATHLCSPRVNQKSKALLVYLSLNKYEQVLETLYQIRYFDRAAIFCDICIENNLINKTEKFVKLSEQVYTEYARFLYTVGAPRCIIENYCNKGGEQGQDFIKELENNEAKSDETTNSKDWSVIPSSNSSISDDCEKK